MTPNESNISLSDHNPGPWGRRPSSPPPQDDLEALIRQSQEKLRRVFSGGGGARRPGGDFSPRAIGIIIVAVILFWLASGFYIVNEGHRGVVLRLGSYNRTTTPGPNYHLPYPFETVEKVAVDSIRTEEIGVTGSMMRGSTNESLMLTGDENIVDVKLDIQWNIKDPYAFLFHVRNSYGENTIKNVAESAVRSVVGNSTYNAAIGGEGRAQIAEKTHKLLQSILDSYNMGVQVTSIQIKPIDPPAEVLNAFRDVQTARADKEREINQAEAYRNDVLPRAKGAAAKMVQEAQAYRSEAVARAEGEANRFAAVYEQYKSAKDVTRQRMYIETMEEIMTNIDKIIIDKSAGSQGVVPYLPLSELNKKTTTTEGR